MAAPMKILLCSKSDNGGGTWFLANAINRYTEHEARQFRMMQCYLRYPTHLLRPSTSEIVELIKWADVVHGREGFRHVPSLTPRQKPTVVTYSGRGFRKTAVKLAELCQQRGQVLTVSTADLVNYAPNAVWLPNCREDLLQCIVNKHERFTVCQAPTFRERKGTAVLIEAVGRLKHVDLDIVENVTYSECLERKALCHVLVDQFASGYGNNAIEAWALGIPVVGDCSGRDPDVGPIFRRLCGGELPYARAAEDAGELREVIERLRKDDEYYDEMVRLGRGYFLAYHHAPAVAKRAVTIYEMARQGATQDAYPVLPRRRKIEVPSLHKARRLNILSLATWDWAGCGYFLSQAINRTTDHHSTAVRWRSSRLQFPHDLLRPKLDELLALWKTADVVHVHDHIGPSERYNPVMRALDALPPKPTVITYHGSWYRRDPELHKLECRARGWKVTVSTQDLMRFGGEWMPDCRPDLSEYAKPASSFLVGQCPTNQKIKSTEMVRQAAHAAGVDLHIIEGEKWHRCLPEKGKFHVLVDQFILGYGCNAIEAWAMGIPVIGGALSTTRALIESEIGFIPFAHCEPNPKALTDLIRRMRRDGKYRNSVAERGSQCWRSFHSPQAAARRALDHYWDVILHGPHAQAVNYRKTDKGQIIYQDAVRQEPPGTAVEAGDDGLVVIEYVGGNCGRITVVGSFTGERYEFDGTGDRRFVDLRDAHELVKPRTRGRGAHKNRVEYRIIE